MTEFKFNCPQCGQPIKADESFCRQTVECPRCGKGIVVPHVKSLASSETKAQLQDTSLGQNCELAASTRRLKSPKLHRIRKNNAEDSYVGAQTPESFSNQENENKPSHIPSRYQMPSVDSKDEESEQNDAGVVVNIMLVLCFIMVLVIGGWIFVSSRCGKKCAELRYLIEQTKSQLEQAKYQPDEKVSQLAVQVRESKERLDALSDDLKELSRRVYDVEKNRAQYGEELTRKNEKLEAKYTSLLNRFESLSRQVAENSNPLRLHARQESGVALPAQPQVVAQNEPAEQENPSEESVDELQTQLDNNLAEIKGLVKKNPACYINPKTTTIANLEKKIATMKDRRYSDCVNITFVRDAFYCTRCKQVTAYRGKEFADDYENCCTRVWYTRESLGSRQGFYRWLEARKNVEETAAINARIDELYEENESLEKKIRSMKRSRGRK